MASKRYISINIAECACRVVRKYSAPKIKRFRKHLQKKVLGFYPMDAKNPKAAEIQLAAMLEDGRAGVRANLPVLFDNDAYMLCFEPEGWTLYLAIEPATPPDNKGGKDDGSHGGGDFGGSDARQDERRGGGESQPSATLDTLISEREVDAICNDGRERPAARLLVQMSHCPQLAPKRDQGPFTQWMRALWAALSRSRTLVRNGQAQQTLTHPPRSLGSLEAAYPVELDAIEASRLVLVPQTLQVGSLILRINGWGTESSSEDRRRRRGLFSAKRHNKRLKL